MDYRSYKTTTPKSTPNRFMKMTSKFNFFNDVIKEKL